tara:strand:- start:4719 stop:6431 length:1713 start_codon:yes stop_codon:yes gene_type:complete
MKNLKLIFEKKHLISIFLITIFIILTTILESLSIGLIFPILTLLVEPTGNNEIYFFSLFFEYLNLFNSDNKISFFLGFFVIIYAVKVSFLVFFSWYNNKFGFDLHNHLSKKIYKKYLEQNIDFFKRKKTGAIIADITTEVSMFINSGLSSLIILISNFFILLGFFIVLILIDIKLTLLLIFCTSVIASLFSIFNKKLLLRWGINRQENEAKRIHFLNQGLNSIKEAKIYNKVSWFLEKFNHSNILVHKSIRNYDFFKTLPRFLIELLILILSVGIILFMYKENSFNTLIPFLGVLFFGFFRTIPIISQMLTSIQSMNYVKPSYDLIINILKLETVEEISSKVNSQLDLNKTIEIKNLSFSYENSSRRILDNINLTINKGDCIGIVGESGAGKSTFVDIVMALIKPNTGGILVDNKNIFENKKGWQKVIGYVPQSIYLIDDSIKKNIAFGYDETQIDNKEIQKSIKLSDLSGLINDLSEKENTQIGEKGAKISGGERQRIAIARCLYMNPQLIIFDEATSSLDLDTENNIVKSISKLIGKKTLIIVSHRMTTLDKCNKIYELKDGKLHLKL